MAGLNFITDNPFTKGYDAAIDKDTARQKSDVELATSKQSLAKTLAMTPFEVREAKSRAEGTESAARVQKATEADRISQSGSATASAATGADQAAFALGEEKATAPDKRTAAAAAARTATTAADTGEFALGRARVNAPIETQEKQATLRNTRANASNAESLRSYELFTKAMDALVKGQTDVAQEFARQAGKTIPPALLNDARLAEAVDKINKDAARKYPNRPADQQKYSQAALAAMTNKLGELNYNPAAGVAPTAAPTPPEQTYAPFRNSTAAGAAPGALSPRDAALMAQVKGSNPIRDALGRASGFDPKKSAQQLITLGRPDLARMLDPSSVPATGPGDSSSPLSTSMPLPEMNMNTTTQTRFAPAPTGGTAAPTYDDGQTKGTFTNQFDPKGSPIYITPDGRRFVVEP